MADLLPWKQVEAGETYNKAAPELKDEIRRGWLKTTFDSMPDLAPEDKVRMTLLVYGQNDPVEPEKPQGSFLGSIPGLAGRAAVKTGRTALQIASLPFVPLDYAREKGLKPVLEAIPGMDKPFNYQGVNEDKAVMEIFHQNPSITKFEDAQMLRQLGMPAPKEAIEQRSVSTRGNVLAHGIELASLGGYSKLLGVLAAKGIAPAVGAVNRVMQDVGLIRKWGAQERQFELSGRMLHNWEGVSAIKSSEAYNVWKTKIADAVKRTEVRDFLDKDAYTLSKTDPAAFAQRMSTFDPGQKSVVDWFLIEEGKRRQAAVDFGILRSPLDNYFPHVMKEEIEAIKSGALFQLHRQGRITLAEREALGNSPFIEDAAIADALHTYAFQSLLGKRMFSETIHAIRARDGLPAIVSKGQLDKLIVADEKLAKNYVYANPAQTRLADVDKMYRAQTMESVDNSVIEGSLAFFEQKQYIHKDFYKQVLRFLPARSTETSLEAGTRALLNGSRRAIMYNPLFHGTDVVTTVATAAPWGNFTKAMDFFGEGAKIQRLGLAGEQPYLDLLLKEVQAGSRIPAISSNWHQLSMEMMQKTTGKDHFWTPLTRLSDKLLFDNIVSAPMHSVFDMVSKKHTALLGEKEAARMAAEYVNTAQGTVPIESFSPFMQKHSWWLLFSRGWTIGNFRSLAHSVGLPWGTRHLSQAGQNALAGEWAETWTRMLAYFNIQNEVMNRFIGGNSSADNPKGHEMDINLNRHDKLGRDIYAAGAPFLAARQMVRRATNIADRNYQGMVSDFYASLGVGKGLLEGAVGKDIFMNRDIYKAGAPPEEKLARSVVHAATALTPFGTTAREAMRPGADITDTVREVLDSPSMWARALTYWPTHGMTFTPDVFNRMSKANRLLVLNSMTPEGKHELIKGLTFGRIERTAAVELKQLKDNVEYLRYVAQEKALAEVRKGNMTAAAMILTRAGWSVEGAIEHVKTRGRKMGRLEGETTHE